MPLSIRLVTAYLSISMGWCKKDVTPLLMPLLHQPINIFLYMFWNVATVVVNNWCQANPIPAGNQWQPLTPASVHYSYDDLHPSAVAISCPYSIYVPFIKLMLLLVLSVHDHRVAVGIALAHWGKALLLSNQISLIYKIKDHLNSNPQCIFVSLQLQNVVISNEATLPLTTRLETAYFAIYTHGNSTVPVNKWCRANPIPCR